MHTDLLLILILHRSAHQSHGCFWLYRRESVELFQGICWRCIHLDHHLVSKKLLVLLDEFMSNVVLMRSILIIHILSSRRNESRISVNFVLLTVSHPLVPSKYHANKNLTVLKELRNCILWITCVLLWLCSVGLL